MRGTEKQIVFAEKLIERFNHQMDELIRKCPEQYKNDWIARKEKNQYDLAGIVCG